ncbi:hypothetical protein [Salinigranum sp. GCM10025319]|uniref:hypothetical protein n=1 Tax=Salinigranum sp. GCM10025319 TaxID=3252687 RepID=UPI0036230CA3
MNIRPPTADPFSVAVGFLVGGASAVVLPELPLGALETHGAGMAVLAGLAVWTLLEQLPRTVDRAVEARLYRLVGALALLLLAVTLGDDLVGRTVVPPSLTLPAVGLVLLGLVVVEAGKRRLIRIVMRRETVDLRLTLVESARRLFVLSAGSSLVGVGIARLTAGEAVGLPTLVGAVVGTTIGLTVVDNRRVDIAVLDRGLVIEPRRRIGTTLVPWARVRRVTVRDGTLRIDRGLPWPTRYECDLSQVDDADRVVDAVRRRRRAV